MTSSSSQDFDHRRFKQVERVGYNLIAQRYAAASGLRAKLHSTLLGTASLCHGQAVLDLASGPGVLAQDALAMVGPAGHVVAGDLAEAMLVESRRRHPELSHVTTDADHLPFINGCFDHVLCGLGLMFFPDESLALREMRRVLKPRGRVTLSVWADAEEVPLVECALACMRRLLPAPKVARLSVFRFGDPVLLNRLLTEAGFSGVKVESCELVSSFKIPEDYWQAFLDLAGGAAGSLARLPPDKHSELRSGVAQELAPYASNGGYQLSSRVLIATATQA